MQDWLEQFLTRAWSPSGPVIVITAIIAILLPILVHTILFRAASAKSLPTFVLIGPSGSGKTSLLSALEKGSTTPTHTSQAPITIQTQIPASTATSSSKYRSENDPTLSSRPKILITDNPGHGKLRHHSLTALSNTTSPPAGIIFVVDASALSSDAPGQVSPGLSDAAEYLHEVLLRLQRRYTHSKTSKGAGQTRVLIAANKMDLFTALPEGLVRSALEGEVTRVRATRSKALADSGVRVEDGEDEDREWLGDGGEGGFEFGQMESFGVSVDVVGGNVTGGEAPDIAGWWAWIGEQV